MNQQSSWLLATIPLQVRAWAHTITKGVELMTAPGVYNDQARAAITPLLPAWHESVTASSAHHQAPQA